jgi:DNA repair protein SbcD/Mre11
VVTQSGSSAGLGWGHADVHLDTPFQGLAQYPGAPVSEIRNATLCAFEKVLDAAVTERVDFLIIAGDLYDTGLKSFESALFFNKEMNEYAGRIPPRTRQ